VFTIYPKGTDMPTIDLLDLVGRDTKLKWKASTHGGEYHGPCPKCGGTKRLLVQPHHEPPRWTCRNCQDFKWGGVFDYLERIQGYDRARAFELAGLKDGDRRTVERQAEPDPPDDSNPPTDLWRKRAEHFAETAEAALWHPVLGAGARAYLYSRGLIDETIKAAGLGYHVAPNDGELVPRRSWGVPPTPEGYDKFRVHRGIVIPHCVGTEVWKIEIKPPKPIVRDGKAIKYLTIPGSSNTLYGVNNLQPTFPAAMMEGSLDVLSVWQEAGEYIAPVGTSSTHGARRPRWYAQLGLCRPVLICFDNEDHTNGAVAETCRTWLDILAPYGYRWRPWAKDPNAMLMDGISIKEWVLTGLEQAGYTVEGGIKWHMSHRLAS
jgi:hypothetical protein